MTAENQVGDPATIELRARPTGSTIQVCSS
jgi:hypothetical protein